MSYQNIYGHGADPEIAAGCTLADDIQFDRFVKIGEGTEIGSNVSVGFNVRIGKNVSVGNGVSIGNNSVIFDNVTIGAKTSVENNVELGYNKMTKKKDYFEEYNTSVGSDCIIRSGAIIYHACRIGNNSWVGNYTILRENTVIGNNTTFGSHIMCEGYSEFGNDNRVYSFCELGGNMLTEDKVFIGPGTITANNPRPIVSTKEKPTTSRWQSGNQQVVDKGPHIRRGAKIGIGCTLMAQIEIGKDALVAGGALVNKNVNDFAVVMGIPAKPYGEVPEYERTAD